VFSQVPESLERFNGAASMRRAIGDCSMTALELTQLVSKSAIFRSISLCVENQN
jgi:hypothetical protein